MKGKKMKKILLLTCGILITFNITSAGAESCAGGHGETVTGVNGKVYCISKTTMNWWSTFAWCKKAQGFTEPISVYEDCDCTGFDGCDTSVGCPNLKSVGQTVWTKDPANNGASALSIYKAEVVVPQYGRSGSTAHKALCK